MSDTAILAWLDLRLDHYFSMTDEVQKRIRRPEHGDEPAQHSPYHRRHTGAPLTIPIPGAPGADWIERHHDYHPVSWKADQKIGSANGRVSPD